ncbi:MAG: hypothetical protein K9J13_00005, partial [Saprospiraceae bacterium]|nr:hypothetical protein [Saprospiraceae bacterium]
MKKTLISILIIVLPFLILAQTPNKEKASFKNYKPGFYHKEILPGIEDYQSKDSKPKEYKYFALEIDA